MALHQAKMPTDDQNPAMPISTSYRGMSGVPTMAVVICICVTVVISIIVIAGAYLAATSNDAGSFRSLINILISAASALLSTLSVLYAGSAANKAGKAAEQTNGNLDDRMTTIVHAVLNEHHAGIRQDVKTVLREHDQGY